MENPADDQPQPEQPSPELNSRIKALDQQHLKRLQENPYGFVREMSERLAALETENAKLRQENEQLKPLVYKDPLTGLDNRRSYDEKLPQEIAASLSTGEDLSVLAIDFDHLKTINDTYGHGIADVTLQAVSVVIKEELHRLTDTAFRTGGDEFRATLPRTKKIGAIEIALRIVERIEKLEVVVNGQIIHVTVSIGIDTYKPPEDKEAARDIKNLVPNTKSQLDQSSDKAMYGAKRYRNHVSFIFDDDEEAEEVSRVFPDKVNKLTPFWRQSEHPDRQSSRK